MNRTMHGFAKVPGSKEAQEQGSEVVHAFLKNLLTASESVSVQAWFDRSHEEACVQLCKTFSEAGFPQFRVGQAQKWLNMSLKYVFVFGEGHLPGYARIYRFAHIPLDNIILKQFRAFGAKKLTAKWSRINSYDDYMQVQRWVRSTFPDSAPLAVEFALWQNSEKAR
jgi:hypothetical protein